LIHDGLLRKHQRAVAAILAVAGSTVHHRAYDRSGAQRALTFEDCDEGSRRKEAGSAMADAAATLHIRREIQVLQDTNALYVHRSRLRVMIDIDSSYIIFEETTANRSQRSPTPRRTMIHHQP